MSVRSFTRALIVSLPCLVFAAAATPSEVVRYSRMDTCEEPFARPPTDPETLHNEAFEWTQHSPLRDWQYAPVTLADSGMRDNEWYDELLEASCVQVSYSSAVRMPEVLQKYTSLGNFRTKIVKTTCVQADSVVLNDLRLTDIPFVRRVHITSKMRFADQKVETLMRAVFVLPWYLRFLESTAHRVVTNSFDDEIQATVHQLCGSSPPPAPPPVVIAPLLPPLAYFTR